MLNKNYLATYVYKVQYLSYVSSSKLECTELSFNTVAMCDHHCKLCVVLYYFNYVYGTYFRYKQKN